MACLFLTTALCISLAPRARAAEEAAKPAADNQPSTVGEVVVTGSALPTTLDAVAVPVSTINAQAIAKGGVTSDVLEILRKNIPAFAGRSNAGSSNANNTNQNTAGGSQVQLRNLDTLVLVNGRRSAIDAIAGIGGKAFVNVSAIPPSAIERIEVLEDGSSAIYGSDAVGGVVNLILKSKYHGAEVGGRYGTADGDYSERSAYFIVGADIFKGVNLTVSGSTSRNSPLFQNRRSFSSPFFVNSAAIPGAVGLELLSPLLNSPSATNPTGTAATATSFATLNSGTYSLGTAKTIGATYDLSQFQTLLLRQAQDAVAANLTADLTDSGRLVAFGGVEYSHNKSFTQFLPRVQSVTVPAGAPFNPFTTAIGGVNFGDTAKPKQYFNDDESLRVTVGLKGDFGAFGRDWKWETAYVHSQDVLQQDIANLIYKPNLARAIAGGFDASGNAVAGGAYSKVFSGFSTSNPLVLQPALDPFARAAGLNPASLANLYGTEVINARSVLDSVDAKVTGNLFTLPGGDVGIAIGGSWRRESLSAHTDPNGFNTGPTAQLWIGGQFNDPFTKSRTIGAVFTEVRVPITSPSWNTPGFYALDLIGALRYEHYSDAGNSTVPKIGFRWQPLDPQFTLRGTFSKSFTAPTLFAEYGPTDTRLAGGAIIQQQAFPNLNLPSEPFQAEDGNNPNLKPAKATSYFLGFVFKPKAIPGLSLSVDYSAVNETGIAGGIGFANILVDVNNKGSASVFFNNLSKNNFVGQSGAVQFSNPGDVAAYVSGPNGVANALNLYAIDRFTNLGGVKVRSVNVNFEYVVTTDHYGEFALDTTAAIFASYKFQALPSQKFYEYAGTATNGGTGVQGTLPKYRFYTTFNWKIDNWALTVGNTYISSVQDLQTGGLTFETNHLAHPTTTFARPVKSYSSWDIQVSHEFGAGPVPYLKTWTLAAGVNNIGNVMPPLAPVAFTDNNADVATYSPIGRLVYVSAKAKF
ncbi:MAG TPA: TonB-dependent receptor plug domain-containing protein [Caulobacteraceae bacterium]